MKTTVFHTLIYYVVLAVPALSGCSSVMPNVQSTQLGREETQQAEVIARKFALEQLNIPQQKLDRMVASARGYQYSKVTTCVFHFFDPAVYPQWQSITTMLGGFPDYFRITVDMDAMKVSSYYAEPTKQ
ncbi:hypothetical protein ACQ9LF_04715 [Anaerohalosphaeraceae bacterium U12dextr]